MAFGNTPYYQPQMGYQPMQYPSSIYQDRLTQLTQQQYAAPIQPAVPMQTMPVMQSNGQGINWVQGEAGAKSFLVTNGSSVLLMDSEAEVFYIKSVDMSGMPTMRTFEYKEVHPNGGEQTTPPVAMPSIPETPMNYVTREEYDNIVQQFSKVSSEQGKLIEANSKLSEEYQRLSEEHAKMLDWFRKIAEKKGVNNNAE